MDIEFDTAKAAKTLAERGLDFTKAGEVFASTNYTFADDRMNYGEDRYITVGHLAGRLVILVWTPRGNARRIISMRKANDREKALYKKHLG